MGYCFVNIVPLHGLVAIGIMTTSAAIPQHGDTGEPAHELSQGQSNQLTHPGSAVGPTSHTKHGFQAQFYGLYHIITLGPMYMP